MCKRIVRPSEVARQFGFHPSTVRRWYRARKINGVKLPTGQILIFQTSAEAYARTR
jgi:hypothetical protein